jgi:ribosomal protein S21
MEKSALQAFKHFVDRVEILRDAQKRYFYSRNINDLKVAKAHEIEIDNKIKKLKNMVSDHEKQPELFK